MDGSGFFTAWNIARATCSGLASIRGRGFGGRPRGRLAVCVELSGIVSYTHVASPGLDLAQPLFGFAPLLREIADCLRHGPVATPDRQAVSALGDVQPAILRLADRLAVDEAEALRHGLLHLIGIRRQASQGLIQRLMLLQGTTD